ncbi:MAG: urease accessory protein UreD [Ramlibacter sp.]|uniref:urease accessory protein UreD n=1 Tax=Ramlibacter sp. TaxID=1917967 RepID=UPI00260561E2|nr:urease accessory protein UreD [Ramlibacter sp.]MDH4375980.1 urease accessory protein UreD [Ramlibacter sp.]
MAWHARLALHYERQAGRTNARFQHEGPLRILQSLHPEGPGICHNVVVHPPSGLVAGDRLDISVQVDAGAHGLVTTPGATRFYRSEGDRAVQDARLVLAENARLEWLPMEALCYSGCQAENRLQLQLAPGSQVIGWDVTALGLPAANQPFVAGQLQQHLELEGVWLERGRIAASDARLMDGPLGLAGHRCMATLYLLAGTDLPRETREAALTLAREQIETHPLRAQAGATSPHPRVVVLRVLAPVVEPAMDLLKAVRNAWRPALWELAPNPPRTWAL